MHCCIKQSTQNASLVHLDMLLAESALVNFFRTVMQESDEGIPSFHWAQGSVDVVLVDFAITIDEVT